MGRVECTASYYEVAALYCEVVALYCEVVAGCSEVAAGCSEVAAGCSEVAAGCSEVAAGCSEVVAGCSEVVAGCSEVVAGCSSVAALLKQSVLKADLCLNHTRQRVSNMRQPFQRFWQLCCYGVFSPSPPARWERGHARRTPVVATFRLRVRPALPDAQAEACDYGDARGHARRTPVVATFRLRVRPAFPAAQAEACDYGDVRGLGGSVFTNPPLPGKQATETRAFTPKGLTWNGNAPLLDRCTCSGELPLFGCPFGSPGSPCTLAGVPAAAPEGIPHERPQ